MDNLHKEDPPVRLGLWGWVAVATTIAVLATGAVSDYRAPVPSTQAVCDFGPDGRHPPQLLAVQWLRSFEAGKGNLLNEPDRELLQRFAAHLGEQTAVASVQDVHLVWERDTLGDPMRVLRIQLTMREPVLPVMLDAGDQAWVDNEGRLLPGIIRGPEGTPAVRGYHRETGPALAECFGNMARSARKPPGSRGRKPDHCDLP